ncbi:chromosome segregation SMC family protein [Novosphingobium sp.]|uniref:chromosome segregation SMC family protein n=1 Tax=Novosphingobium sp. TaxID=1874826 RepID=UPI003B524569
MQFKRLRLSGFKSFVEPAELRIEPGLTGVVGPNGCGKSNLLEAIRWVMGENSARAMRGGGMDDVIFAGTARRPAREFAEVTLSVVEGADAAETDVTRRIERGAGSVYRLNGRDVRARDIALVFADAATGAHSPALVSQGRIAAVIAAKPAERRAMLEDAAGIAGLHVRRREAETRLRATETNLGRLDDLVAGLEVRIGALRRQARAAERYTSLSERIRIAEGSLVFARWRDAAAAATAAKMALAQAEGAETAAREGARTAQGAQHATAAILAKARETVFDRRQDLAAHTQRMTGLALQLQSARDRLSDINRQIARIAGDRELADRVSHDAAQAQARLTAGLAEAQTALNNEEDARPAARSARDRAEIDSRAAELALAAATAAHAGIEAEWRVAEASLVAARQRLTRSDADAARITAQSQALAREPDPARRVADAETARDHAATALAEARTRRNELSARREAMTEQRDSAAQALAAARADLIGLEREAEALSRDKATRDRMAAQKGATALSSTRIAPGYERALAAALGRDALAAVGPAPALFEGRVWTGAVAPTPLGDALSHHVSAAPPELAARLALVRVADGDSGQPLAPGEWLVTRDGRLRRWDGFVASGEGAAQAAVLEADNRLTELHALLAPRRAALDTAQAADTAARAHLAQVQTDLAATERTLAAHADAERAALRALDAAQSAQALRASRAGELARARADCADQRAAAQADATAAESRRAALPDPAAGRMALDAAQALHQSLRVLLQTTSAALAGADQAIAVGRERVAAIKNDLRNWQSRASDATRRLTEMAARADELASERAVHAVGPDRFATEIADGEALRDRLAGDLLDAEVAQAEAETASRTADAALAQATETLANARETRAGHAARAQNEDQRRIEMAAISGERFQCPPPLLPTRIGFAADAVGAASAVSADHDRLLAERERLGPVNLVAADDLASAEGEHGATIHDRAELIEAVGRLRGSIGALNREGRDRLRAAFEAVDAHFRRLFARLFDGGEAHLAFVDSDDPLEAGLEIFAQPPGKRLQSLTLLSGGEQALTAVALIFALFLTNPAPICVLDEVDAPLDDANVERFCDMLDAMVGETRTRYLIVTHNAVTMSRMHRLFGVTMVEPGVSRLVSVDLGGAERLLTLA